MKKTFKFMMMALTTIMMSVGFAACSSDDDGYNGGSDNGYYALSIDLSYSEDLLSLMDITVTYTDANGQDKTEAVTSTTFKKQITYSSKPSVIKYTLNRTRKSTIPDKDKFDITIAESIKPLLIKNGASYVVSDIKERNTSAKGVKKEELDRAFEKLRLTTPLSGEYRP